MKPSPTAQEREATGERAELQGPDKQASLGLLQPNVQGERGNGSEGPGEETVESLQQMEGGKIKDICLFQFWQGRGVNFSDH